MKAVFSFWSKPYTRSLHKSFAGFPSQHYFRVAFELAILTARDSFSSIELVTDTEGYKLLVETMGLKFDRVRLDLNDCADIPANLWAFGKLKAYSVQKEPFIHLDFDVFLLKPIAPEVLNVPILTQSVEELKCFWWQYYTPNFKTIERTHTYLPLEYRTYEHTPVLSRVAYNAGILGGTAWQAIADYAEKAMLFIRKNLKNLEGVSAENVSNLNVTYEQYYLSAYAVHHRLPVSVFLEGNPFEERNDVNDKGFCHLLGTSKGDLTICRNMEISLKKRKAMRSSSVLPKAG